MPSGRPVSNVWLKACLYIMVTLLMAVLTGDCNNESFLQENVWLFCWAKKSNHDNEVTIFNWGGC